MEQEPPTQGDQSANVYPPPPSFYTDLAASPTRPIDSTPPPYLNPLPDPLPFRRRRRSRWPTIAALVGALVVVAALGSAGFYFARAGSSLHASAPAATPTNTVIPTATPFPTYVDANPSCDNNGDWSAGSGTKVTCNATSVTITDPTTAKYIGELDYNGAGTTSFSFPGSYQVSVNVSALDNACGGLLVLGSNPQALGLYLCQDGSRQIVTYDANGTGKLLKGSPGGAITLATSNMVSVLVTPSRVQLTINGTVVTTLQRTDTLATAYVSLAVYPFYAGSDGSATFDSFSYHPLSAS